MDTCAQGPYVANTVGQDVIPTPPSLEVPDLASCFDDDLFHFVKDLDVSADDIHHLSAEMCAASVDASVQQPARIAKSAVVDADEEFKSIAVQRIDRTRERNRKAQARYRRKQREQCVKLERRVQELQAGLSSRQQQLAVLRQSNDTACSRLANASDALVAMAAKSSGLEVSHATAPLGYSPLTTTRLHVPARSLRAVGRPHQESSGGVVSRTSEHRGLYADPFEVPAPIESFRYLSGISYELLHKAVGNTRLPSNVSHLSYRTLIDQYKAKVAESAGCAASSVCWFATMHLDAAPGLPCSFSSTLSSPECVASFVLYHLCASLECALVAAAMDRSGGEMTPDDTPDTPGCQDPKRARSVHAALLCDVPGFRNDPGSTFGTAAPQPSSHAQQWAPDAPATDAPPLASATAAKHDSQVWSGMIRAGLNRCCKVHAAVRTVMHAVIEPFVGVVPMPTLNRLCLAHRRQAQAVLDSLPEGPVEALGMHEHSTWTAAEMDAAGVTYHAGVTEATREVVHGITEATEEIMAKLPLMEVDSLARAAPPRCWLLERSSMIIVSLGLAYITLFRDAGRIIRRLAIHAVSPLMSFYEVDNMQVSLYRELKLTSEQREKMAAYWNGWEGRKRELDSAMNTAREALCLIPASINLPMVVISHICAVSTGTRNANFFRDVEAGVSAEEEDQWLEGDLQLLGADPEVSVAAREALTRLWAVHVADADLYADTLDLQLQPRLIMGLEQIARVYSGHLVHDAAQVDFMALCQLAKTHQYRDAILKWHPF